MVSRIGGNRRKTRGLLRKIHSKKGKFSLRFYLQEFSPGDRVVLKLDPGVHEGLFFRRFYGKVGVVQRKQGTCFVVKVSDGSKDKFVIAHPAHLRKC